MYKEIHPLYRDNAGEMNSIGSGERRPVADFYNEKPPVVIDISTIRMMRREHVPDGSLNLVRLSVSPDNADDLVIREAEALEIRDALLKPERRDETADSIRALTSAIRDLWNLLRARLH